VLNNLIYRPPFYIIICYKLLKWYVWKLIRTLSAVLVDTRHRSINEPTIAKLDFPLGVGINVHRGPLLTKFVFVRRIGALFYQIKQGAVLHPEAALFYWPIVYASTADMWTPSPAVAATGTYYAVDAGMSSVSSGRVDMVSSDQYIR